MNNSTSVQSKRILILYVLGFLLVFGYGIARTCIDSLLLEHYKSDIFPKAWLVTALVSVLIIAIYNRLNQKYAILSVYGAASLISAFMLAILLVTYFSGFIPAIFVLYVWKEIYMVVLMETYWSFADIVFSISTARFTYGMAMAVCSFGGIFGSLLVGPLAKNFGTKTSLCSVFILLVLGFLIAYFARSVADEKPLRKKDQPDVGLGIKTLFRSKYLVPLAVLVCAVQIVIALIDYRFNTALQENYTNTDLRTQILGQIHAAINVIAISIQIFTGPLLRLIGIANAFLSIPILLGLIIIAFIFIPTFGLMMVVRIGSKALDYSLLRGIKEIFYIPLSREEKTQGKGIIDIFIYRLARGLSSVTVLGLIAINLHIYVMEFSLALIFVWFILALIIGKRYQMLVKNEDEA